MVLERHILHLDVADFAVAVERVVDPSLRGFPVVVAPPTVRAVALAASVEARAEGIAPGLPIQEARRRCRALRILAPDEALYGRAAAALQQVASRFTPLVEGGAPGRVYLDVTGTGRLFGPAVDLAARLQGEIRSSLRLEAALGVAANKLVSRVAADLTEPTGLLDVRLGDEAPFLAPLPVVRLPGIGEAVSRDLKALNVTLVRQLVEVGPGPLSLAFGRFGVVLFDRARGIDPRPVRPRPQEPEVLRESVLPEDSNDPAVLRRAVRGLAEDIGRELRRREVTASRMRLEIRYADARGGQAASALPRPAELEAELARAAEALLASALTRRVRVRGLVLRALGLARRPRQLGLFDDPVRERDAALTEALDRIRARYGDGAVQTAA